MSVPGQSSCRFCGAAPQHLSFAWGRLFFIYGPDEASGRLLPSVAEALKTGPQARSSDGEQVRDFVHVKDAVGALLALTERRSPARSTSDPARASACAI